MRKINYSKFDLNGFTKRELERICRYYGIEYLPSWSKEKLIEEILNYSPAELVEKTYNMENIRMAVEPEIPSVVIRTEPIKSIRIARIEENKRREE